MQSPRHSLGSRVGAEHQKGLLRCHFWLLLLCSALLSTPASPTLCLSTAPLACRPLALPSVEQQTSLAPWNSSHFLPASPLAVHPNLGVFPALTGKLHTMGRELHAGKCSGFRHTAALCWLNLVLCLECQWSLAWEGWAPAIVQPNSIADDEAGEPW